MLYALGALLEFDLLYDISGIRMSIVQPRLSNTSTFEMSASDLIHWADAEVPPKALLAYEGKSRGTAFVIVECKKRGIPVKVYMHK